MIRILLLGLLWAASTFAVDLTGEWRRHAGDDIRWAAPDFDDRHWSRVTMPTQPDRGGTFWLRRKLTLSETIDDPGIALGMFASRYEIYLDGVKVAAAESAMTSAFFSPRWFALSTGPLPAGRTITLALRVPNDRVPIDFVGLPDIEPYFLGPWREARDAARFAILRHQHSLSLTLVAASLQLVFALLLAVFWGRGARNSELIWFAGCLLCFGLRNVWLVASAHQELDRRWPLLLLLAGLACLGSSLAVLTNRSLALSWLLILPGVAMIALDSFSSLFLVAAFILFVPLLPIMLATWILGRHRGPLRRLAWPLLLYLAAFSNTIVAARVPAWPIPSSFFAGPFLVYVSLWISTAFGITLGLQMIQNAAHAGREKARLAREMEAAREVQGLLLSPMSAHPDYVIQVSYEPAAEVGGDFHWRRDQSDGSVLVAVGDVSGKGLRAAMLVSVAVGILRTAKSPSPAQILKILNEGLTGHTGGGFVTCCCARFDPNGTVTLASAGHPAPYAVGREVPLDAGLPLGMVAASEYTECDLQIHPGQQMTFLSDGVVEAENPQRELFGFDRTCDISTQSAQQIAEVAKAWGQNDDITVVTVRRNA